MVLKSVQKGQHSGTRRLGYPQEPQSHYRFIFKIRSISFFVHASFSDCGCSTIQQTRTDLASQNPSFRTNVSSDAVWLHPLELVLQKGQIDMKCSKGILSEFYRLLVFFVRREFLQNIVFVIVIVKIHFDKGNWNTVLIHSHLIITDHRAITTRKLVSIFTRRMLDTIILGKEATGMKIVVPAHEQQASHHEHDHHLAALALLLAA